MTPLAAEGPKPPARRLLVAVGLVIAGLLALGIVVGLNRYPVLLALLGEVREPSLAYRVLYLSGAATLLAACVSLALHLFVRRWWSMTLLLLSSAAMVAAVSLNLPPRYGRYGAERDFVEQFGQLVRDDVLAQSVYDATFAATLTIIIGLLLSAPWALLVRYFGEWSLRRNADRRERFFRGAFGQLRWIYPILLAAVILWIAL